MNHDFPKPISKGKPDIKIDELGNLADHESLSPFIELISFYVFNSDQYPNKKQYKKTKYSQLTSLATAGIVHHLLASKVDGSQLTFAEISFEKSC
jgi:hypothetical protein